MEEEQQEQLTPEAELELLSKKQQELQQKIAQARADNAAKQMNTLSAKAQARIDAEAQEALVLAEIRRNRQLREAEAQREAEAIAEVNRKEAEVRMAQQLLEKRARQQAEELAQHLKDETEKMHRLEMDLARQLLEGNTSVAVKEDKPATLETMPSPLAHIFGSQGSEQASYQGLSSEETARIQMKRDAINNMLEFGPNTSTVQTALPTPVPTPKKTNRKAHRFVDMSVSNQLETLLKKELGISVGPMKLDDLGAAWQEAPLMQAAREVVAMAKAKPMSADGVLEMISQVLESQESNA